MDLVEVEGELAVGFHAGADDVGHDLLVGGPEAELAAVSVGEAQQFVSVDLPSSGFPPEVGGLHGGQKDLGGPGAVHLLADDGGDLGGDAPPQRQPRVDSAGELADKPGAQHQPMADNLRLRGRFPVGMNKKTRSKHKKIIPHPPPQKKCPAKCRNVPKRPPGIPVVPKRRLGMRPAKRRFASDLRPSTHSGD